MNMFSVDTFKEVLNYLPVKIGVAAITVMSGVPDQILRVFLLCIIFCMLACLDIATRWWACGAKLWSDLYPQTEGSLWRYIKFMRQSHRWRYFRSEIMRDKWMSKMGTYITIILFAAFGDAAMSLVHGLPFLSTVVISVLACTEMISCLENLNECGISIAMELVGLIKKRKEQIK